MKTHIWTLPTRIFHWLLAISFTVTYILSDFENLANLHYAFGAFTGTLILFRIIFGFIGPKYSNFKDFPIGIKSISEFFKSYFSNTKEYVGHNPAASVVMLLILIIGLLTAFFGFLIYAIESNLFNVGINEHFIEETHETLANLFLALVIVHLIGVFSDFIFHKKTGTLKSIFTGNKNIEAEDVKLNSFQKLFVIIGFIVSVSVAYFAYNLPPLETEHYETEKYENGDYEDDEHDDDDD